MVSTLYGTTNTSNSNQEHEQRGEEETSSPYHYYNPLSLFASAAAPITSRLKSIDEKDYHYDDEYDEEEDSVLAARGSSFQTPSHLPRRASAASTAWANTPQSDLLWMFRHNKNPYNAVRGRDTEPSSMTAVRSLVALVPNQRRPSSIRPASSTSHGLASPHLEDETEVMYGPGTALWEEEEHTKPKSTADQQQQQQEENLRASPPPPPPPYELRRERSDHSHNAATKSPRAGVRNTAMSASETASQLAEGTLRALRDLALDEAVELQAALRFWSDRWERPLLSWLEAGPLGKSGS